MNIVSTIKDWRELRRELSGKSIGFVPTMGNLHEGHMSLCDRSMKDNDVTVVSIFINPTQFNQSTDFERYPRTLDQDGILLAERGIDYLFVPSADEMYPDQYQVQVLENTLSATLEGEYRPGHFTGMLTVVLKLLNLVQPARAYFGEKDMQQLLLVKKMVDALFLSVEIISCETVRALDGLALSSRNTRLNPTQRELAAAFARLLRSHLDLEQIKLELQSLGFQVDYIAEQWGRRLGAVWLGDVRLIDNVCIHKG